MRMIQSIRSDKIGWTATSAFIIATAIRAGGWSNLYDLVFTFIGSALWAYCGYRVRNHALVTVNVFGVLIVTAGLIRYALSH